MLRAKRLLHSLFAIDATLAVIAYLAIAALLLTNVAMRELGFGSLWGAMRVAVYLMIVTGFLGLGLAAHLGRHLRPRVADGLVPRRAAGLADRLGHGIMALTFAVCAGIGAQLVWASYSFGDTARTIGIAIWPIQIVVPYAFASLALRHACYGIWPALVPSAELSE